MPTRPDTLATAVRTRQGRAERAAPSLRGYGHYWQKVRKAFLALHPFCRHCGVAATEVDHITPLSAGGTNDHRNLQSLCKACHSRKTVAHDGGFGFKRGVDNGRD